MTEPREDVDPHVCDDRPHDHMWIHVRITDNEGAGRTFILCRNTMPKVVAMCASPEMAKYGLEYEVLSPEEVEELQTMYEFMTAIGITIDRDGED